ncbi:hypothetical protein AWC38_SpisGene22812 [Stylophora pistillata]|uniref:Uncharacterized protein n=1 Tax=Stylophora pistillata TaxID=50429 RepID=A0A2B4R472_STYPI|nr:hypothetical protein AWC38_SpisGene22812 [Stylophora pistillata]
MKVLDRPSEMPEMRKLKKKEDINAYATLMTCNLQKGTAPKHNNTLEEWRLDPKRLCSGTRLVRVHVKGPVQKQFAELILRNVPEQQRTMAPDTRFRIILPCGHWLTKLIIKHYNERGNHVAGVKFTLCQRDWIIAAREEIREWDHECNEFELGVTWRFNPPAAQHFGGALEVMMKVVKKATYAVVGERDVNDEKLITVLARVESLLKFPFVDLSEFRSTRRCSIDT